MSNHANPILIGCSGWSYPEWGGPFYPADLDPSGFLEFYADRFPIVEVDSSFYRPPTLKMAQNWRNHTPDDFRLLPKVPQDVTHKKRLVDCKPEVEIFVGSLRPLGDKLAGALLQMGYFNQKAFAGLDAFLPVLDEFLALWPHQKVPLAVEIRNPKWMTEAFTEVLRKHNAALTVTDQKWMPAPAKVAKDLDPVTGSFSVVRLIGDREATEALTKTFDQVVIDRSADLASAAEVIASMAERVPVYVFVNNHYAGHAPETARQLRDLLGIPEPVPTPKPRRTLFD